MEIAILGYGVVGSGVAEVIRKNSRSIEDRAGEQIRVRRILDIREFPDSPDCEIITRDPEEIFGDPDIKIIVETIGGIGVAHEYTKRALGSGRHVVTSNKELVAVHGPELLKLAADNGVSYLFEASVGGGIPIIRPLSQCLAANVINGITGVLNGTTNYILTKMRRENRSFSDALKNAQENGYAEADPTADIEGHDTCRKIAILSSIAYNEYVDCSRIHTEGISKITLADMLYAEAMDSVIKLVAVSRREGDRVFARVSPSVVSREHPLAGVEDVFNAIVVSGDAIGDAMFYGRGAGKLPTASAVVADVIDIVKHNESTKAVWKRKDTDNMVPFSESMTRCLVRTAVRNKADAAADIERIFGPVEYVNTDIKGAEDELAFTAAKMTESSLCERVGELRSARSIKEVVNVIRLLE